jgi:esterase/lipase
MRWLACLPEMLVRHRVVDVLLRQVAAQFEADYVRFHHPQESRERSDGAPILLKGTSRNMGIVLVHGFLAVPRELLELAAYLNGKGFWVYCVRLRGHGTSPEDLATRKTNDWVESVDVGYAMMSAICRKVVIGGFSFGGGLALDCAARVARLAGVFAVAPPFRLQDLSTRFASAVTTWNKLMDTIHCHGATKEYSEITLEQPLLHYSRLPIVALSELEHFMKNLEPRLSDVKIPTLVVQGHGDPVVNSEGTALLYNRIGAIRKQYLSFDFNRHGILAGEGSEKVHGAIGDFIDNLGISDGSSPPSQ